MVLIVGGIHQGKYAFAASITEKENIIADYELQIRQQLERGEDCLAAAGQLLKQRPQAVITLAELGCGLIPAEQSEREYREVTGRVGTFLAGEAKSVYRVICGIPQCIKGDGDV